MQKTLLTKLEITKETNLLLQTLTLMTLCNVDFIYNKDSSKTYAILPAFITFYLGYEEDIQHRGFEFRSLA